MFFAYPIAKTIFELEIREVRVKESANLIVIDLIVLLSIVTLNKFFSTRFSKSVVYNNLMYIVIGTSAGIMGFSVFLLVQSLFF